MATSTFDRRIEITDPEAVKRLDTIIMTDVPDKPLSDHPYTEEDRKRSVQLLRQCLSRSKK